MSDTENNKVEITSTPSPEQNVPTDPAQLAAAVRAQVEYYFSKDNLKSDSFLISKMDAQNSVAISTILTFAKLKKLTEDEAVVLDALQGSTTVLVLDGRIKSSVKQGRNTIILREIAADISEEDIREIFNYPGCKPITSIKSDIGDTWFVVMESEADAKDVVLDLKLKKRMFGGSAVKARLKSEAVVNRSYYPTTAPVASNNLYPGGVMYPYGAGGQMDMQQFGGGGYGGQRAGGGSEGSSGSPRSDQDGTHTHSSSKGNARSDNNSSRGGDRDRRVTGGGGGKVSNGGASRDNNRGDGKDNSNSRNKSSSSGSGAGRPTASSSGQQRSPREVNTPAIEINSLNFPPLPPQGPGGEDLVVSPTAPVTATPPATTAATVTMSSIVSNSNSHSVISANTASFTPAVPTSTVNPATSTDDYSIIGYGDKPFAKYQIDDIINVVKNIKEAVLPDTIHTTLHPLAMEVSPNVDLLLRQRTFSIDETREQMQQGRPVQRDAVISGEVDYNSVMYGDDQTPTVSSEAPNKQQTQQKKKAPTAAAATGSWAGVLKSSTGPSSSPPPTSSAAGKVPAARTTSTTSSSAPPASSASSSKTAGEKAGTAGAATGGAGKKTEGGGGGRKGASSGSGRKEDGRGNKSGDKKDGRNGNNQRGGAGGGGGRRNEQKDKEPPSSSSSSSSAAVSSAPPLKWGDKPSFANILKAKDDPASAGKPASSPVKTAPLAQTQAAPRTQRSRSNSESSGKGGGNGGGAKNLPPAQVQTAQDGTWSKQKLPPLKKTE